MKAAVDGSKVTADFENGVLTVTLAKAAKSAVRVRTHLADGAPEREVARLARRRHAALVVIGTHGRTGLSRAFMGSVAERIVRSTACPVLTVRRPG